MMTETDAALYLNKNHSTHFTKVKSGKLEIKEVTPYDIKRWIGQNRIHELTELGLDEAIKTKRIPPKRGRPRTISQDAIDNALEAIESGMTQSKAATMFGISASMLSRVRRKERREYIADRNFEAIRFDLVDDF